MASNMFSPFGGDDKQPRTTMQDTLLFCLTRMQSVGIRVEAIVLSDQSHSCLSTEWFRKVVYEHTEAMVRWTRDDARGIHWREPVSRISTITSPEQLERMKVRGVHVLSAKNVALPD